MRTDNSVKPNAPTSAVNINKYFPLPELGGLACIVKHYGEDGDVLVNTRIEAVGFLNLDPALEAIWQDSDAEDRAMHPPPSLVPRLHAILIRKLSHCNPALPYNIQGVGKFIFQRLYYNHLMVNNFFQKWTPWQFEVIYIQHSRKFYSAILWPPII